MNQLIEQLPPNIRSKYEKYTQNNSLNEFVTDVTGIDFWVNYWGSCQYSSAYAMFLTLCELNYYLSYPDIFKLLNVIVTGLDKKMNITDVLPNIKNMLENDINSIIEDEDGRINIIEKLNTINSIDEIFILMQNIAWSLWASVPTVFKYIFPETKLESVAIGDLQIAPNGNHTIEYTRNNLMIGLQCWILYKEGYVENDECFRNFDT